EPGRGEIIIREMEVAFAIGTLQLEGIAFEHVETGGGHETPTERLLIVESWAVRAHIAQDDGELRVANFFIFPADIEAAVRSVVAGGGVGQVKIIDFRGGLLYDATQLPLVFEQ